MTRAEVVHLLDRLRETPLEGRRKMHGLSPDRADIIVAGVAAVSRLARRLRCQRILINDRGIRDGLLLSMLAELQEGAGTAAPEARDRMEWVRRFARKCRSNERHTRHVARLAEGIFDDLEAPYSLPEQGRDVLVAAALLHDIGYLISHAKHHKHAYHLILHSDVPGFSAREVELIANVARYHRRAFPKRKHANFSRLSKKERRLVRQLSGILRVADGLDRSHAQAVSAVRAAVDGDRVRLELEAETDPHVESWDATRKAGLFEEAFRAELEIWWTGTDGAVSRGERLERAVAAERSLGRRLRPDRAAASGERVVEPALVGEAIGG